MTFEEAWQLPLGTILKVSDGTPPPPNIPGSMARNAWKSHNFTGELEEKIERDGWRYLKLCLDNDETPDVVDYLAYEVADGPNHTFEQV